MIDDSAFLPALFSAVATAFAAIAATMALDSVIKIS
jgi:hypothetical protein